MNNSFAITKENYVGRNFGGTTAGIADPYISGYHFIKWVKLPPLLDKQLKEGAEQLISKLNSVEDSKTLLEASCLSVTPPSGTLNKAEFTGLGGTKFSVPTNIDYGNTITIKFLEFSGLPILHFFSSWVKMIRDYRTGVSNLMGDDYSKQHYAGTLLYWTTKPDGRTVEFSSLYTGVFPTKDPRDLYTGDVTSVDKLEPDIEFSIDWAWREDWVHAKAQQIALDNHIANDTWRKNGAGAGNKEAGF